MNMETNYIQPELPDTKMVLVLGIISIPAAFFTGIVGLVCGIIALNLAKKAKKTYLQNPGKYQETSYSQMNTGRICALIGTILSAITVFCFLAAMVLYGV